jgi:hypothetical protein
MKIRGVENTYFSLLFVQGKAKLKCDSNGLRAMGKDIRDLNLKPGIRNLEPGT